MRNTGFRRGDAATPTQKFQGGESSLTTSVPRRGLALSVVLSLLVALLGAFAGAKPAYAATAYELEGEWAADTSGSVRDGETVSAAWRVSVNDDAAAPGNEPVDNVTFTATLTNGMFDGLPALCLVDGVDPVSSISEDGSTLVCNLGAREQGTAVVVNTAVIARGATGDQLSASAEIGGSGVDLDPVEIVNPFGMDIRWEDPVYGTSPVGTARDATFQWTLFHDAGGEAGPDSVSYDITVTNTVGSGVAVGPNACAQFTAGLANGHPWSGGAHPSEQLAPFVGDCTFTRVSGAGSGTATFRMTLTGIDYSYAQRPTTDSTGNPLPPSQVAVASGQVTVRINTPTSAGAITITSNAPPYTAVSGATSVDDDTNNSTTKTWTSGVINHAWVPGFTGSPAGIWSDSYRAAVGATVRQSTNYNYSNEARTYQNGGLCLLLDTRYVQFEEATTSRLSNGEPIPGATMYYYTGSEPRLDPSSSQYDPNQSTACQDSGGWTTTLPADLSTVRAVKVTYPLNAALRADRLRLFADTRILESTPVGQDIWTWGAWANTTDGTIASGDWYTTSSGRSTNPADVPTSGTLTPGARYPFAYNGRDALRTVGVSPEVGKDVTPRSIAPGDTATYTLTYSAESAGGVVASADGFRLVDRLPEGMTYVPGSASPEPEVTAEAGRQVLTWALDGVATNEAHTLTYQAQSDASLEPGTVLTNVVSARVDGLVSRDSSVDVRIATDGFTQIGKTADQAFIPNTDGDGSGEGSWTVTVRSEDPAVQEFTDTIDVLPYNGDGRGTDFSGSYELSGPVEAPEGATVYYTTDDPASLSDDPDDASNGAAGDPAGNSVGWSTTFAADATAVRVIGGELNPGATVQFVVPIVTDGMAGGDVLVNRAASRAENTRLIMLTSAPTTIANFYSASLKKYVQDADGEWHDADDPVDYPVFRIGDEVTYRVVIENTGGGTLTNIAVADDRYPELGAFTVDELASGQSETHEYTVTLTEADGGTLVNTASATTDTPPDTDEPPVIPPDEAGIDVVNYTVVKTSDPESGSGVESGDTIAYTITVIPEGNVPADAWLRDSLAEVLDDAAYNDDAAASVGEVTVEDGVLEWSGTLQPGEPATITYSVTVNEAEEIGDGTLANTVLSPGCQGECETEHDVRSLTIEKTSDATEDTRVGDVVTYTVTATNSGPGDYTEADPAVVFDDLSGVLDDTDYNDDAQADMPGDVSFESPLLAWSGALPAGESVELTYTVTLVPGGDGLVRNVAWIPEDPVNPEPPACSPPNEEGVDPETGEPCAEVEFALPRLTIFKSADQQELPAVGEPVTYEIRVMNTGEGDYTEDAPAQMTDDLTRVLDDATFNNDAVAVDAGGNELPDQPSYDTPNLSWSGPLGSGESVTIRYTVTYTGGGNHILLNNACVPEEDADPGASACDYVQVPGAALEQWKTVEASDEPVMAGSTLTYTLHFKNSGAATAQVDAIDHLSQVIDDAVVTTGPVSSHPGLTATLNDAGDQIAITGTVNPQTVTMITYTVTIGEDGERGDDVAANFLLAPGEEPPAECAPTDDQRPNCTTTPIAAVTYAKSVQADSDPVGEGTVLTYTVTVENTGTATAPVSREDVLTDVLDDADLTSDPVSDTDSVTVSDVVDGRFQIGGEIAAGETATITYQVTVMPESERGDNSADNFLVTPGGTPPEGCAEGDPECTSTPLPMIEASKSSDPESGATVTAGQEVTYTLTFTNTGEAAGSVDYTDDLSGVFDDATLVSGPEASEEVLTAASNADDTITVTGVLTAGQTVTVSYTVTVNEDSQRGDNRLGNVLAPTGTEDPDCEDEGVVCTEHPVPLLDSWKQVEADESPVAAGTVLTYTLFFENTGQAPASVDEIDDLTHVTDDADVTAEPSSDDLTVTRDGNRIAITGEVAPGDTVTVTYQVTVRADGDRGDDIAANFLMPNDPEDPPTPPEEPVCQPEDTERPDCTVTPIGKLLTGKTVSADTDPVDTGTVLTYTLTFDNQGQGPIDVDHTDILTDVLDDADLTTIPTASDDALSVSEVVDGRFTVSGELAAGQTVMVTYQVTVKEEADRGNNTADNFLIPDGETPPEECVEGDPNCTVTPLPLISVGKTADPETGSDVQAGQEVTYTLTFTNTGEAAGPVDYTDNLGAVLDDADLTGAPTSSEPAALVATDGTDGKVRVTGSLEPGQTVTVFYTVTVKPDGDRGDNELRNVVAKTGTENPDCEDAGVSCTEHPIGELNDWKSVDPASGTTVQEGAQLTYTLHFENTGNAPVQVNREDVLTQVLDDADVTGQPVASSNALTVTEITDGRFQITGTLQPGRSETVTYTVTVKADGQRGDDRLGNFLVNPGEEPPAECVPEDGGRADCTINHVNDVGVAKSSDPASGSEVNPGDEVTYTLTFENTSQNPDAGPVEVDYTDHMADVLDDATLTGGPAVSNENLQAVTDGDTIRITGAVPTGETYTVTYTVTVNTYAEQGNHMLGNVVAITGEEPVCVDGSPLCTDHEVPEPPVPPVAPEEPGGWLPSTGAEISAMVVLAALLLLGLGGGMVLVRRRRAAVAQGASQEGSIDDLT